MKQNFLIKKYNCIVILLILTSMTILWFFQDINMITFVSIFQIILFTLSMLKSDIKIFSISYLFIILTYITHLGHFFIYTFNINADIPYFFDTFKNLEISRILKPGIYISTSMGLLIIGMLLGNDIKLKHRAKDKNIPNDYIKIIGKVFICIGIIFEIYVDYNLVSNYLIGGYLATTQFIGSGIINILSNFFRYGLLFLMISYRNNRVKLIITYIIYNCILIIPMLSGNRFNSVLFFIIGAYLYFMMLKKTISYKTVIKLTIVSLFLIAFINIIADYRTSNLSYSDIANNFVKYLTESNIIFDAIGEFGVTFYSVYYSMLCIPSMNPYGFGFTYITSIITAIPNVGNLFDIVNNYLLYTSNFPPYYRGGLGGSYIGELYYNFGWASLFFYVLLGLIIVCIEKKLIFSAKKETWLTVIKMLPIFVILLMWIRGYFREFIRVYIWNLLLIYFIVFILNRVSLKKNK